MRLWLLGLALLVSTLQAQPRATWRAASPAELQAFLPARAPVEKERIETEMRTATGITDDHGHTVAAVVLITAGYAAEGKYSPLPAHAKPIDAWRPSPPETGSLRGRLEPHRRRPACPPLRRPPPERNTARSLPAPPNSPSGSNPSASGRPPRRRRSRSGDSSSPTPLNRRGFYDKPTLRKMREGWATRCKSVACDDHTRPSG